MSDGGTLTNDIKLSNSMDRPFNIAYIGPRSGTSLQRAKAMERLGHHVNIIDPHDFLPKSIWTYRWLDFTGGLGVGFIIDNKIFEKVNAFGPQLIWVNQGPVLGGNLIRTLRSLGVPIINYTNDDPFGGRDGRRFRRYMQALPFYDLLAVVREVNVAEAYAHGVKKVVLVSMTADEVEHRPRVLTDDDIARWGSEVCFVGTWMPERGPFMVELIKRGVPLSIWGDNWRKAPEWNEIAPYWRGPAQSDPEIYSRIIQSAKICIGLLSKGNRDKHTTRSMEIPALGGLLCAERTDEHLDLYIEGEEAIFWDDATECAEKCHQLLKDEEAIKRIKANALSRARRNNKFNEKIISDILSEVERV